MTPRTPASSVTAVAEEVLNVYAAGPDTLGHARTCDAGPAVLATLVSGHVNPPPEDPAAQAMSRWLRRLHAAATHPGLFGGGLADRVMGMRAAVSVWPSLAGVLQCAEADLVDQARQGTWRSQDIGWSDYDLVSGPSGLAIALTTTSGTDSAGLDRPAAHLAGLCDRTDLRRLRLGQYRGESMRGWNHARINTGVAHGVAGVVLALSAVADSAGPADNTAVPLERLAGWLLEERYADDRGIISWSPAGREGRAPDRTASRRQAWCYGTPGIAWALWEAGRTLGDERIRSTAVEAAASFLTAYDDGFHGGDPGICHGAAGVMLLADCFDRSADLPGASALRDDLHSRLTDHLADLPSLAQVDSTLLTGACGIAAALLTVEAGERRWLAQLGLR